MRSMFAFGISLLLGLSAAGAQVACPSYPELTRILQREFNEVAVYTWPRTDVPRQAIEFWVNEETGSFTLVRRLWDTNQGCITGFGIDLVRMSPPSPGDPT